MFAKILVQFVFLGSLSCLDSAFALQQLLVLSGGGSPEANRLSQYLQTKQLTEELKNILAPDSVEVLFGIGNSEKNEVFRTSTPIVWWMD